MATKYGDLPQFQVANGNWQTYLEQMQFFFMANGLSDEKMKKAIFLSSCGTEAYTLLKSIAIPKKILDDSFTYDMAVDLLSKHFCPTPNEIIQRFQFYRRDQLEGESIHDFLAALRKLSQYCNFADLDGMLRDRLVCGIRDEGLQKRLLANDKLTLKIAQEEAIASEAAQENVATLKVPSNMEINKVVNIKEERSRYCYRCGGNHKAEGCKFKDVDCRFCKKRGHIERACITKSKIKNNQSSIINRRRSDVNQIEVTQDENELDYILSVVGKENSTIQKTVFIEGQPIQMEIDSGASYSIISEASFRSKIRNVELHPSHIQLRTWGTNKNLKICGQAEVDVAMGGKSKKLTLLVVGGDGPALIGRNWFNELGIGITMPLYKIETEIPGEISKHVSVFDEKLGDYKGEPVKLAMSNGSNPKFFRSRQVPFALKPKIEAALEEMVEAGVLRPVKFSEWATPIVPVIKPDGNIRICGDYKCTVNQQICKETYPLPTNTEVFATLANCKWYSKLDLDRAYTQVKVDDESAKVLTLNTHRGLYEVTRLPFGISTAPSIFQRIMEGILGNLPGVVVYLDDILIGGKDMDEMWERTRAALKQIEKAGLKLKKSKCIFAVKEVTFLGFTINELGIRPTDEKIRAIAQAPEPKDKQQLQAFLGLITFYDRFFKNKGSLLEPLYRLLKKNTKFIWGTEQQSAFNGAKQVIISDKVLVHYSAELPLLLCGDASPYGVGAVLAHIMPDGREAPIAFGSRTLQPAEKNYSQLDKEALAVIFGVKKFHQFLSGRNFTIITDHKPLLGLFDSTKPISQHISPRMLRWSLILGAYQYEMKYREGKQHQNADTLSRLPLETKVEVPEVPEILYCGEVENQFLVTSKEIAQATLADPVLSKVLQHIKSNYTDFKGGDELLKPYSNRMCELSVNENCVLWGSRVIIPASLHSRMLEMLHEVHQGMTSMKAMVAGSGQGH